MCSLQGGDSVLHEATLYGQLGTISALLSTGMPVDVRNNVSCYICNYIISKFIVYRHRNILSCVILITCLNCNPV